jgi:hypothetical protein
MTGPKDSAQNEVSVGLVGGLKLKKGAKGGHLASVRHGLCVDFKKFRIDGRSTLGRTVKENLRALLSCFNGAPPVAAQLLAKRTAFKMIQASVFEREATFSEQALAPSADERYLKLTNSIREDVKLLHMMARDLKQAQRPTKKPQDLDRYLKAKKKRPIRPAEEAEHESRD